MSYTKDVTSAFQVAVDRALCEVSRGLFDEMRTEAADSAVQRISRAMKELDKLRPEAARRAVDGSEIEGVRGELAKREEARDQPDYADPDVARFYTQWYLPQQINVTYSETVRVLGRSRSRRADTLQLVDYGAGTGAMVVGLALAIANHAWCEHWPKRLRAYQIDHPAMLDAGQAMWDAILKEAHGALALQGLAEVMSRTVVEHLPLDKNLDYAAPPTSEDAERWLTAIHVAYEDDMPKINVEVQSLCSSLRPHVSIRTAPWAKKRHLKGQRRIRLRFGDDVAPKITLLRKDLNDRTGAGHPFLDEWVGWEGDHGSSKAHYATTACRSGAEWNA